MGTLEDIITSAIENAKETSKTSGSRELALVITKLEEAQMWFSKIVKKD